MNVVFLVEGVDKLYDRQNKRWVPEGDTFETTPGLAARYRGAGAGRIVERQAPAVTLENTDLTEVEEVENKAIDVKYDSREEQLVTAFEQKTNAELEAVVKGFGIDVDSLEGTGANGNLIKADYIRIIQENL